MRLTAQVKLMPDEAQRTALLATMRRINLACNDLSVQAWQAEVYEKEELQKLAYYGLKERFDLSAQVVIRTIAKVADSYKADKTAQHEFRPHSAIAYDSRILSWTQSDVSIWTLEGRLRIPFVCGARQFNQLFWGNGESDLVYRDGQFYLYVTVEVPPAPLIEWTEVLGVDLGIVNIAADSDGRVFSGKHLNRKRESHRRQRQRLQSLNTKSAKRLLKKRRRKEARFAADVNHCIAKKIVATAKRTKRAIALEQLAGILSRVRARKPQRSTLHSWSFDDLGNKILYKACLAGVPVFHVDPRNTSKSCPECGYTDRANRPTRDTFCCLACGCAGPADTIAAINIGRRAAVSRPHAGVS